MGDDRLLEGMCHVEPGKAICLGRRDDFTQLMIAYAKLVEVEQAVGVRDVEPRTFQFVHPRRTRSADATSNEPDKETSTLPEPLAMRCSDTRNGAGDCSRSQVQVVLPERPRIPACLVQSNAGK